MFKKLIFLASAIVLASAQEDHVHNYFTSEMVDKAIVKMEGNVTGSVTFTTLSNGMVQVTGNLYGMPAGRYGFHVHEKGDLFHGCDAMGEHFNPYRNDHGGPQDMNRHVGDLGNVRFDYNRIAKFTFSDREIKLQGPQSILGRGLVLHSGTDDYGRSNNPDSKKSGNSGSRVACGVIGIA